MKLPNPLIAGFNPDPSVAWVPDGPYAGEYYLVTSTFEYLPGIPVYRSTDLMSWELVGHVIDRISQFDASEVPTGMGIWAPTIRFHDGLFHVIVSAAGMGTKIFTATDPTGMWTDGVEIAGLNGIDPDLAWDDDGRCFVTFSGLVLSGPEMGKHLGIQQVEVDPESFQIIDGPNDLWSGTGGMFPEAPHLYHIDGHWYLLIAEGGTERGHAVTIARGDAPTGPFEGAPNNPILTARGTARPIQNTGHGDLVPAPDGTWSMVMLGMRTRGMTRSFSALGRESFGTDVTWSDGWPSAAPVELDPGPGHVEFVDEFADHELGPEWIAVRRHPREIATVTSDGLRLVGEGRTMSDTQPTFVGRRQRLLDCKISTVLRLAHDDDHDSVDDGESPLVAGLVVRYDEVTHFGIEYSRDRGGATITSRVAVPSLVSENTVAAPDGDVELILEMHPIEAGFPKPGTSPQDVASGASCDEIHLVAIDSKGVRHVLAKADGRYLTAETTCSFTGRVAGLYCSDGTAVFGSYRETPLRTETHVNPAPDLATGAADTADTADGGAR